MSSLILWIDTHEAIAFQLLPSGIVKEKLQFSGPLHPVETLGKNHPIHQTDQEKFFHRVCVYLEKVKPSEWLILGSGPGPDHFLNHIERHHAHLRPHVLDVQKIEKMTEAQIIDHGMAFFKKTHIFKSY